ncbi:MAG: pyridoxamine 5'-phosphate oxidase family protein [Gallionellaceae bacterium]
MQNTNIENIFHEGELEAHRRYCADNPLAPISLRGMIRDEIALPLANILESQLFFFIATANHLGQCDCSFRGREFNASGQPYPLLKVFDSKTIIFPDFSGNHLYNSLGNIIANANIGMLFVDFQNRSRARVNGTAEIIEDKNAFSKIWPSAKRYIKVGVEQAYPNCKARIPRMTMEPLTDSFFDD